jgi:tetratricopeptide (TPR) repeat protein
MIGLVQVGTQTRADRYTYLSQIGVAVMAVWGVADLAAHWNGPQARRRWALGIGLGALLAAWTVCCRVQVSQWRDSETVWNHALAVTGPNYFAEGYLGRALLSQGRYEEAAARLQDSLTLAPQEANTRYLLCNALLHAGRTEAVAATAREGLALDPGDPLLNFALGNVLLQQGAAEGAAACFREVLASHPGDAGVHNNLGAALARQGRMAEAIAEMEQAVALDPNHAGAHSNLGHALRQQGRTAEGTAHLERALALALAQGNAPLADSLREELHPSASPNRTH